jgi:hypothetical protein|tara:strand:- start:1807 stop:1968 length:162 start_codon:yes stop_codon:yes gene_type:complete
METSFIFKCMVFCNLAELPPEENTWGNAVEVAMLLFIETMQLIMKVLEAFGGQ